jgi:hypothetical protein
MQSGRTIKDDFCLVGDDEGKEDVPKRTSKDRPVYLAKEKTPKQDEKTKLTRWSVELGDKDYKVRRRAEYRLRLAGAAALPYLKDAVTSDDLDRSRSAWKIVESRYGRYGDDMPFDDGAKELKKAYFVTMDLFARAARLVSVDHKTAKLRLREIADLRAIMTDPKNRKLDEEEKKARVARLDKHKSDYENLNHRKQAIVAQGARVTGLRASSRATDETLATVIVACPNMDTLLLSGSRITDKGVADLARLSKLDRLFLRNTAVTDACVKELVKLKNLRVLNLTGTKITQKGLDQLKKDLPECTIHND